MRAEKIRFGTRGVTRIYSNLEISSVCPLVSSRFHQKAFQKSELRIWRVAYEIVQILRLGSRNIGLVSKGFLEMKFFISGLFVESPADSSTLLKVKASLIWVQSPVKLLFEILKCTVLSSGFKNSMRKDDIVRQEGKLIYFLNALADS